MKKVLVVLIIILFIVLGVTFFNIKKNKNEQQLLQNQKVMQYEYIKKEIDKDFN